MQTCRSEESAAVVFIHLNRTAEQFWISINSSIAARYEAPRREGFHKRSFNSIVFPQLSSLIRPSPGGVVLTRLRSNRSPFCCSTTSLHHRAGFFFFHPSHTVLIQRSELLFLPLPGGAASLKCGLFMGSPSMHFFVNGGGIGSGPGACWANGCVPASVSVS